MRIEVELPSPVQPEDRRWIKRVLPVLVEALLALHRAGGKGRESELIPLIASDVLTVADIRRAATEAQQIRASHAAHADAAPRKQQRGGLSLRTLIRDGELIDAGDLAQRLRWTKSKLAKAVAEERVFSVHFRGAEYYPSFYATDFVNRRELFAVTKALTGLNAVAKVRFLYKRQAPLGMRTPLQALLAGELALVLAAAKAASRN